MEARRSPEAARSALLKRRAKAEERAKEHIEILRASAAMRRHQLVAEALQRVLLRGRYFVLDKASDIFEIQPWAIRSDGALLGHVLTVDDVVFESVTEECLIELLNLPEALDKPWADLEQRSGWVKTYADALRSLAEHEECKDNALRQHADLSELLDKPDQDAEFSGGGRM